MLIKICQYDLIASQEIISPDGYTKLGMVINGMFLSRMSLQSDLELT